MYICTGIPVWWIRDVYPGSWFLPIPDPGSKTATKERGGKKILVLKCRRKKFGPIFLRIIELFTQTFVKKLLKIWSWDPGSRIRDPGSGIRKKPIPDPGSRGQKGTGSRIRNTAVSYGKCHELTYRLLCPVGSGSDQVISTGSSLRQLLSTKTHSLVQ